MDTQTQHQSKPVIMLVIDTLMDAPLQNALENDNVPALKFFMDNGNYCSKVVSPFPTMSVNVDTTLLTGTYCNQHQLPGLVWFNQKENRLINYGSHIRELWKLGLGKSLEDILFNLNEKHISNDVSTIHEDLEKEGKASASINALIYKGNTEHFYHLPKLLTWFTHINKNRSAKAATLFSYGSLSKLNPSNQFGRFWQRFGFNNSFSVQELNHLIREQSIPSFTIVYLPELDKGVHKHGRMYLKGIKKIDQQLQSILDTCESWDDALQKYTWILIGDNGQAWVDKNRKEALIDLREIYKNYKIMKLKQGVTADDQIVLGVNERMAYIYSLDADSYPTSALVKDLENDKRIDVIAWKDNHWINVKSGFQKGLLKYHPAGEYFDEYDQSWTIEGDLSILDLTLTDKKVKYGEYPDALARLNSSLHSHQGDFLIASSKPGHEFIGEGSPRHVGGASHGGLHEQDSLIPMIVTGTESRPKHTRMVDLKEWILFLTSEKSG